MFLIRVCLLAFQQFSHLCVGRLIAERNDRYGRPFEGQVLAGSRNRAEPARSLERRFRRRREMEDSDPRPGQLGAGHLE